MTLRTPAATIGALAAAAALLAPGCGGGATEFPPSGPPAVGGDGQLTYAIPSSPGALDPLGADTEAAQTVTRQIFEPLVGKLDGPYGRHRHLPGIALAVRHSADLRVWSLRLRPAVRFGDGRLLDAAAVLANTRRWRDSPVGHRLLSGLIGADGPRPNLVRFVFASPVSDLESRLSNPSLGLVSPDALSNRSGGGQSLLRVVGAGSGPFQLSSRSHRSVRLRRNRGWWGSELGLGPALDEVIFRIDPSLASRLASLRAGTVQIAGDVGPAASRLRADPLLTAIGVSSPDPLGLERSVRGVRGPLPQSLAGVWVTGIDRG